MEYFDQALEFFKQLRPSQTYQINGMTIVQDEIISEGGYGYVYKAHDKETNRRYALKTILVQDHENEEAVMREVSLWEALGKHKNICEFYGHGILQENDTKKVVILCEYGSEGTLVNVLERHDGSLIEEQIIYILTNIATGLKVMHEHDPPIAHRDIKVENILQEEQAFKLADFGSCSTSTLDYKTDDKRTIGAMMEHFEKYTTMMYRPPEMIDQYQNYSVDTKVDIWMLGGVLFTLGFAKHPFQDAQKLAIINGHYFIPDEDHDRIGTKLRDLIRLMLTPDPRLRPNVVKIISILENWNEIDQIPLNEGAFKIKSKQEAISKARNKTIKEINDSDLLEFHDVTEKHKAHIKHAHSMVSPKISPPVEKGWADFDGFSFSSQVDKKVDDKKEDNWFDFSSDHNLQNYFLDGNKND